MIVKSVDLKKGYWIEFMDNSLRLIKSINVNPKEVSVCFFDGGFHAMSLNEDIFVTAVADEDFINTL